MVLFKRMVETPKYEVLGKLSDNEAAIRLCGSLSTCHLHVTEQFTWMKDKNTGHGKTLPTYPNNTLVNCTSCHGYAGYPSGNWTHRLDVVYRNGTTVIQSTDGHKQDSSRITFCGECHETIFDNFRTGSHIYWSYWGSEYCEDCHSGITDYEGDKHVGWDFVTGSLRNPDEMPPPPPATAEGEYRYEISARPNCTTCHNFHNTTYLRNWNFSRNPSTGKYYDERVVSFPNGTVITLERTRTAGEDAWRLVCEVCHHREGEAVAMHGPLTCSNCHVEYNDWKTIGYRNETQPGVITSEAVIRVFDDEGNPNPSLETHDPSRVTFCGGNVTKKKPDGTYELIEAYSGCHQGDMLSFVLSKHNASTLNTKRPNCTTCHNKHDVSQLWLLNYTTYHAQGTAGAYVVGLIFDANARISVCGVWSTCHKSDVPLDPVETSTPPTSQHLLMVDGRLFILIPMILLAIIVGKGFKAIAPFITILLLVVVAIVTVAILYAWLTTWRAPTELLIEEVLFLGGSNELCTSRCHVELYQGYTFSENHSCRMCHISHLNSYDTRENYITTYQPYDRYFNYKRFYNVSVGELSPLGPPGWKPQPHGDDCLACHVNIHDDTPQPNDEIECYNCHLHAVQRASEGPKLLIGHLITKRKLNLSEHIVPAKRDCTKPGCHEKIHSSAQIMVFVKNVGAATTDIVAITVNDASYPFVVVHGNLADGLQPGELLGVKLVGLPWREGAYYKVKVIATTAETEDVFSP
jgi:cytochrome c553